MIRESGFDDGRPETLRGTLKNQTAEDREHNIT